MTEETPAWWLYPFSERERVTIEMPAGVVGIWGTFWSNLVSGSASGSSTAVLSGHAEVTSGGQTVSLGVGQTSTVPPSVQPPSPPAPLSPSQQQGFGSQADWIQGRAQEIQNNAPVPPPPVSPQGPATPGQQPPGVLGTIQGALEQLSGGSPGSGGGPASDGDSPPDTLNSAPAITGPDTINLESIASTVYQVYTIGGYPAPTCVISFSHANTANATFSGTTLSIPAGLGAGTYYVTLEATNRLGTATKTITVVVSPAESAPAITGPDTILSSSSGTTREYTIGGYPAPTCVISSSDISIATFSGTTLSIPANFATGTYSVTLEATNTAGTTTKTVTVYVIGMEPASCAIDDGDTNTVPLAIYGDGPGPYTFFLQSSPSWVTLSGDSGDTLTVAPPAGTVQPGDIQYFQVDVLVTDGDGNSVAIPFSITVNGPH